MIKFRIIKQIIILAGFIGLFIYLFRGYENKIYSVNFVDKEDNMTIGKYLASGQKLYSDIFTNHQPVPYIMSAFLQKITHPTSIAQLVKRHREFVLLWSFLWSAFFIYRFGAYMMVFIVPFEMTKLFMFGNLFLAEVFVVYPSVYLLALICSQSKKFSRIEYLFLGAVLSFIFFSLSPLVPFVAGYLLIWAWKIRPNRYEVLFLIAGIISIFLVMVSMADMGNYYRDSIFTNTNYYIPTGGKAVGEISLSGFVTPLIYLLSPPTDSDHINLIKIDSIILLLNLFLLFLARKRILVVLIFILIGLANLRTYEIATPQLFHLLPWYSLLLFGAGYTTIRLISIWKNIGIKLLFGIFIAVILFSNFLPTKDFFLKESNRESDAYIHFSIPFDYGEAVRIMKGKNDTMFAVYNASLAYWQAGISPATPFVFYYPWMQDVPFIGTKVEEKFENSPPEFIIYQYFNKVRLDSYLKNYKRISKDSRPTDLYILDKKYYALTDQQYKDLAYYHYSF